MFKLALPVKNSQFCYYEAISLSVRCSAFNMSVLAITDMFGNTQHCC